MTRRLLRILTLGAIAGLIVVPLNPVHSTALKLAFLGCLIAAWAGLSLLVWKRKPLRTAALMLPVLLAIPLLLPGSRIDPAELRKDYVRRMTGYEGTRYYWGGENFRGIDCSGLPRRAYRDALLAHGLRHLNGRAFRAYAEQWWFDASAKALGQGYRGYTTPLSLAGTIRTMPYETLLPGDLAITASGIHVLAYAGDGKWIQADPGLGAVATRDGRSSDNGWFNAKVTTHRWKLLAEP